MNKLCLTTVDLGLVIFKICNNNYQMSVLIYEGFFWLNFKSYCSLVFYHCFCLLNLLHPYFVSAIHVTSTLLLLLLQTKAHIHTTQVKDPCSCRQCCSVEHLSVLLSFLKIRPCAPVLHPLFREGCMFLLPYMDTCMFGGLV